MLLAAPKQSTGVQIREVQLESLKLVVTVAQSIFSYATVINKKTALVNLMLGGNYSSFEHLHNLPVDSMLDRAQDLSNTT